MTDNATRQRVIDGLRGLDLSRGTAASRAGLTPAGYCAQRLRSWAKRNGKPLTDNQAHVLRCCETMQQRLQRDEQEPKLAPDASLAERKEVADERVKRYAAEHGLPPEMAPADGQQGVTP